MSDQSKHPIRGILAGAVGGLVASWVMNQFFAVAGKQLTKAVLTPQELQQQEQKQAQHPDEPDATMKAADAITEIVTGGQHLTYEQQQKGGPIVHYAFGTLAGGIYGGLAEYSAIPRAGFGTTFGSTLFAAADLLAVPSLHLSQPLKAQPAATLATPLAAHLVYGVTTELVRRMVRRIL